MANAKIRTEIAALCDYAMTGEDKKLSIIGIFDKLFVRALPSTHARLSFVVTFVSEPNTEEKAVLKIISPNGAEEFKADVKLNFGENGKFNFVSNFEGLPFKEVGTYRFLFEKDDKEIVGYNLDLILLKDNDGKRVAN